LLESILVLEGVKPALNACQERILVETGSLELLAIDKSSLGASF
jgi:hypothetical protein